jgi:hypothetical protein
MWTATTAMLGSLIVLISAAEDANHENWTGLRQ